MEKMLSLRATEKKIESYFKRCRKLVQKRATGEIEANKNLPVRNLSIDVQ